MRRLLIEKPKKKRRLLSELVKKEVSSQKPKRRRLLSEEVKVKKEVSSQKLKRRSLLQEKSQRSIEEKEEQRRGGNYTIIECWKMKNRRIWINFYEEFCIKRSSDPHSDCYGCTDWQEEENRIEIREGVRYGKPAKRNKGK